MKAYFDEEDWKTCIDRMACKKQQCTFETCQSLITDNIAYYIIQIKLFESVN